MQMKLTRGDRILGYLEVPVSHFFSSTHKWFSFTEKKDPLKASTTSVTRVGQVSAAVLLCFYLCAQLIVLMIDPVSSKRIYETREALASCFHQQRLCFSRRLMLYVSPSPLLLLLLLLLLLWGIAPI